MKLPPLLLVIASADLDLFASASWVRARRSESNWTVGQTVSTTSGPVTGHAAANQGQVSEYLGIPFAQAPIGDLRWEAPVVFNGTTEISGASFGDSCPVAGSGVTPTPSATELQHANVSQLGIEIFDLMNNYGATYSEDCLYLNVWTQPQSGEAKKAVMVWFYGGGFTTGSSTIPMYDGEYLAALEDVVVVSFNYRLSILGFPGAPDLTQNLAFLDQRMAVEWVRDNIASFGGDPTRITLFGQSAGGASVDFYSYAWASDPIAAGFIPESGTAFSWGEPTSADVSADGWYNVSKQVGCGTTEFSPSASVLACMKTKSATELLNYVPTKGEGVLGSFGPTVDNTVVFANYTLQTPAQIPLLIGSNDYEAGLFRTEFALEDLYFSDTFWDDFTLASFTCPAAIRANASIAHGIPTWRYRYLGVWPDLALSSEAGTWHGAEIPLIFNTAPSVPAPSQYQLNFAAYMRGAWAAFAKDPMEGLSRYGWPGYKVEGETLVLLAGANLTGPNAVEPVVYDADCQYVNVSSGVTPSSTFPAGPSATVTVTGTGTASSSPSATKKSSGMRIGAEGWGVWILVLGVGGVVGLF